MKALKENYKRNIAILRENIKRGMDYDTATGHIEQMENQFLMADCYQQEEKDFIKTMRQIIADKFTSKIIIIK